MVGSPVQHNGGRVAKNTTYLTLALIGQKVLSALYIPIIAGLIGPSAIGEYLGALSFINIFAIFIDIGLTQAFIRQTARDQKEGRRDFNAIITFKIISSLVVTAALLITVWLMEQNGISHPSMVFIRWAIVGMIIDSLTSTMYGFFRGLQRLEFESIGTVLHRVVVMIVGITALQLGGSPVAVIIALVIGSGANFLYAFFHMWRQGINWQPNWSWPLLKKLIKIALPFGIAALFLAIYANSDNVLLQQFKSHREVGLYGTANKMVLAFQIIPAALVGAIFPAMSAAFMIDRQRLARLFHDATKYLMVVFVPIMVVIFIMAEPLVLEFYKKVWLDAVWPLRVLSIGLPFLFLHYPIGYLLNAANRQTRNTINIAIVVAVNIGLNLLFIKEFSYKSVAVISVFSSALLFCLGLWYARQIIKIQYREILATFGKTLLSGIILASVGSAMLPYAKNIPALVMIAAVMGMVYLALLFLFKIVTAREIQNILSRIKQA